MDSNSLNINREATDDLIKYVAGKQSPYSNGNSHGSMGKREALNLLTRKPEEAQPYINEWMRERMPSSSTTAPETLKKEYDDIPIASTVNLNSIEEADKVGRRTISHAIENEGKDLKQNVSTQIKETQQAIKSEGSKSITTPLNEMQREHERQSKSVGIVEAARGAIGSVKNAYNATEDLRENIAMMNPFTPLSVVRARGEERFKQEKAMSNFSDQGVQVGNAFDGTTQSGPQHGKYDDIPIASPANLRSVEEADKVGLSTISHDRENDGKDLKQNVNTQIKETSQVTEGEDSKSMPEPWNSMQSEHERQSKSVGIAEAYSGAIEPVKNAYNASEGLIEDIAMMNPFVPLSVVQERGVERVNTEQSVRYSPEQSVQVSNALDGETKDDPQPKKTVKIVQVNAKEEPIDLKAMNKKSALKN